MHEKAERGQKVILIDHLAGGWLTRATLGDSSWDLDGDACENDSGLNGEAQATDMFEN